MIVLVSFVSSILYAEAALPKTDVDWPDRKYFTGDSYPGLEGEKEYWEKYYELKGTEYMMTKKQEILKAYDDGVLKEWVHTQGTIGDRESELYTNNSNSNAWYYFWINEEVPHYNSDIASPANTTADALNKCQQPQNIKSCYLLNTAILIDRYDQEGDCIIATASYGSPMANEVQMLREIRDLQLMQTESGSTFMMSFNTFYYSFAPTIAQWEHDNSIFKEIVKMTITPLIASLSLLQFVDMDSEIEVLGYGISVIMLNVGMYFVAPAVTVWQIKKRIHRILTPFPNE